MECFLIFIDLEKLFLDAYFLFLNSDEASDVRDK